MVRVEDTDVRRTDVVAVIGLRREPMVNPAGLGKLLKCWFSGHEMAAATMEISDETGPTVALTIRDPATGEVLFPTSE